MKWEDLEGSNWWLFKVPCQHFSWMTEKMCENRANAASIMITLPEYKQVYSTDAQQHQPVDTFTVNQMPTHPRIFVCLGYRWDCPCGTEQQWAHVHPLDTWMNKEHSQGTLSSLSTAYHIRLLWWEDGNHLPEMWQIHIFVLKNVLRTGHLWQQSCVWFFNHYTKKHLHHHQHLLQILVR